MGRKGSLALFLLWKRDCCIPTPGSVCPLNLATAALALGKACVLQEEARSSSSTTRSHLEKLRAGWHREKGSHLTDTEQEGRRALTQHECS